MTDSHLDPARHSAGAAGPASHPTFEGDGAATEPSGAAAGPDEAVGEQLVAEASGAASAATQDGSSGMLLLGAPIIPLTPPTPSPEPSDVPPCAECGGRFGTDGYCERCGTRRPNPRHHLEQSAPAAPERAWVGGVCDRGIRHLNNEDALAVHAAADGSARAALVVCDGVSTARRSARASQAAAEAALAVLTSTRSRGLAGVASALIGALGTRLDAAAEAANNAVLDVMSAPEAPEDREDSGFMHISDPACTFVAAVIDGTTAVIGSIGDSRGYWLPDEGGARLLTRDDSWAEDQIALGVSRAAAEAAPHAHAITRWLGADAPDHPPAKTTLELDAPGWLLLCTDGLWNYASEPEQLAQVVREVLPGPGADPEPVVLARRLAEWANAQGGRDNVTVALARIDGAGGSGVETGRAAAGQGAGPTAAAGGAATGNDIEKGSR